MEIIAKTHIGNVRKVNQDCVDYYIKDNKEALIVVCDGMGGHRAGEVASSITCKHMIKRYQLHDYFNDEEIMPWLKEMVNEASELIRKECAEANYSEGMGTTCTAALIKDHYAYIVNVGDSRAYIIKDGILTQLTTDDTLVNALVEMGSITKEDAKFHPKKNVLLQAVGFNDTLNISTVKRYITDELLLVCTDGLYNSLTDEMIINITDTGDSLIVIKENLLLDSIKYGGHDNIGFVIMKYKGDEQ